MSRWLLAVACLLPALAAPLGAQAIEVFVCGPHNRVLASWMAAAEAGDLPRSGVSVVHFDAHPDLGVPKPFPPGWPPSVAALLGRTTIASFQLAAVWAGLVDEVIWVRPAWASQFPDGVREFRLGAVAEGRLAVDDPSDYYVLDGSWAPGDELRASRVVRLRVLTLEAALEEPRLTDGPTILDIDLDGFATRNPAAERLRHVGLTDRDIEQVRRTFAPEGLDLSEDPATRVLEVAELVDAVESLASGDWSKLWGSIGVFWRRGIRPGELWALASMLRQARGPALDTLLDDGQEVVGLPERLPNGPDMAKTARQLADLVRRGVVAPSLVTVARSVEDGFTPAAAWPQIETALIGELNAVLPNVELRFDAGAKPLAVERPPMTDAAQPRTEAAPPRSP